MTLRPRLIFLLLILLLAACGGQPTPQVVSFLPTATAGAIVPTRRPTEAPQPVTVTAAPSDMPTATETTLPTEAPTITHTPTETAMPTDAPTETATATTTPTVTPSETPTATHTPTETFTPTPSTPVAQAVRDIPVRGGPAGNYPVVGTLAADAQLDINGISEDGNWYKVVMPDGSQGWVISSSAQIVTFGDLRRVPVALAPTDTPTYTPTFTPTATDTPTFTPTPTDTATVTPTATNTVTSTFTPTITHTPTVTPTDFPEGFLPEFVLAGLQQAGVTPDNGSLGARLDRKVVDVSDADNTVRWESFSGEYGDFVAGTTIQWGPGDIEDDCGILFREVDEENFYAIRISRDGFLWFAAKVKGEWQDSVNGDGTLVRATATDTNQLEIVAAGSSYTAYLNGEFAGQFTDDNFSSGQVALAASTYEKSVESNCTFTNAWVWKLNTPLLPAGPVPDYVVQALQDVDLGQDSGSLAARLERRLIDNTDKNDQLQWVYFNGRYGDFAAGTTFAWGPGATEDYCGLVFRNADSDNFYSVQLNQEGLISFSRKLKGKWENDINGQTITINQGEGATNELTLVVRGNTFRVYVNGGYGDEFTDANLAEGRVAVMAGTYDESDKTNCTFTHNWLWQLGAAPNDAIPMIGVGDTITGTISGAVSAVRYTFEGQVGDVINIRMNRESGDLDPLIILLDANGAELTRNDDAPIPTDYNAAIQNFTLPAAGTYTIVATRFQEAIGLSEGDFSLTLEQGP